VFYYYPKGVSKFKSGVEMQSKDNRVSRSKKVRAAKNLSSAQYPEREHKHRPDKFKDDFERKSDNAEW